MFLKQTNSSSSSALISWRNSMNCSVTLWGSPSSDQALRRTNRKWHHYLVCEPWRCQDRQEQVLFSVCGRRQQLSVLQMHWTQFVLKWSKDQTCRRCSDLLRLVFVLLVQKHLNAPEPSHVKIFRDNLKLKFFTNWFLSPNKSCGDVLLQQTR